MTEQYEGIVNPPIDTLLERVDSKYALVTFASKRARQINAYYSQLHEGLFEYVGPLVDTALNEKPLSIALREIEEDLLVSSEAVEVSPAADLAAEDFGDFSLPGDDDPFATIEHADVGQPLHPEETAAPAEVEESAQQVRAEEGELGTDGTDAVEAADAEAVDPEADEA